MIVTCERCTTQFQLDDAKVPEGGVRVRCSRCDHAFSIESPQRTDEDHGEDLAREALREDPADAPEPESEPESEAESDWEFNEDLPVPKTAEPSAPVGITVSEARDAASSAVDDLLDLTGSSGSSESNASIEPSASIEASESIDSGESGDWEPDDSFADEAPESVGAEAFSSDGLDLSEGESPDYLESPDMDGDSLGLGLAEDEVGAETRDDTNAEIDFDSAIGAEIGIADDAAEATEAGQASEEAGLGDPEEWNFFDEPGSTTYAEVPPSEAAQTVVDSPGLRSEPQVGLSMPTETVVESTPLWRGRIGQGIGWAIVTALCLFGLVRGFTPVDSVVAESGVWAGGGFEAQAVRGRWLDTISGRVYVISGEIRRATPQASAAPLPQIRLLDRAGEFLTVAPVPLGPERPESWLREAPAAQVAAMQARTASFARRVRSWEPFLAVAADVPDAADRFAFDVIP